MISEILEELKPYDCGLVAVSKTKPHEAILSIYNKGQRVFGENRAQELKEKAESLPKDIEWHMIGHLQKNKVKYLIDHVSMIHSVDNLALAQEINKRAKNSGRKVDILLQLKIAEEVTKSGFEIHDCLEFLNQLPSLGLDNIRIVGLMGMASFTDDMDQVRKEFQQLKTYFDQIKQTFFSDSNSFKELSMGMSGDYKIALEEGATLVRIGSLIFGSR